MKIATIISSTFAFLILFNSAMAQKSKEIEQFHAVVNDQMAGISWVIKRELEECNYRVERSADGDSFSPIHILGGTPSPYDRLYVWTDKQPLQGVSWYRIKKITSSGIIYSPAMKVKVKKVAEFSQR